MSYVRCINNTAYIEFENQPIDEKDTTDLTIGHVYKAFAQTPDDQRLGELRVYDDTSEDYLFPVGYFEPYTPNGEAEVTESLTIHMSTYLTNILRAEALASQTSMSALLRDWIDERLDLPEPEMA
ncbi:MAG: hypothetical protein AAF639_38095 [Chloroflexota bacterium]